MKPIAFLGVLLQCTITFAAAGAPEPGLLFYLSGEHQFNADFAAGGDPVPTYLRNVQVIPDGAKGKAFHCDGSQLMAYLAPGNIYAQRGTLSFFWRSHDPVGPTEFPVFRVGYADHSSWDMVFLRIDYNGHGFDAFVTDTGLARTRVSVTLSPFPKPDEWTHLALAWDETRGIRFYANGKLAGLKETVAVYNAGLDQFGPHSRIISPYQVQSDYNFIRGGDIDEVRIHDRMLSDENIAELAKGNAPQSIPEIPRSLDQDQWRAEWWLRYGFNRLNDPPPYYEGSAISVRKVEIHDAYDLKRWYWKATDGIRETTWPGVYNRSRLPGRNDYFQLPDWDCYVESGKAITFIMPEEPWNQVEIAGPAYGKMELLAPDAANDGAAESILFQRQKNQEKTVHRLAIPITGRKIRFTNVDQEVPIEELVAYNVTSGTEPAGSVKLAYRLTSQVGGADPLVEPLRKFIAGRFPVDERATLYAQPVTNESKQLVTGNAAAPSLPIVHILIPDNWDNVNAGLDGIAIDLPALNVKPTHGELFPLNIQVKDPLWTYRDMLDFTFSVKPGEAKTVWLDLRDRLLPAGKGFYITIAGAGGDFNSAMLEGAQIRLVFKPKEQALAEDEVDRFTQAKDSYAMLVEEHPHSPKLNLWNRFQDDITDLMRVDPNHYPGRNYAAAAGLGPRPVFTQAVPPAGVPLWAFRQVELLGRIKHFVTWYVDNRQVPFGDFGGGISDDVDLLNTWPGVALMGCEPEKLTRSVHALLEAAVNNGMFTNGLPTIQTDELHSYEEGIDCLSQNMIIDYGNPRQIERAMETARGIEKITGINPAGNRLFRTSYYNGNKIAEDGPWGWAKPYSYLVLQPPELLVDFNGNPEMKKVLVEIADGLLAHRKRNADGTYSTAPAIQFETDKEGTLGRGYFPWHVYWTAYKWTGDKKYLDPINDAGATLTINPNTLDILNLRKTASANAGTLAWQLTGNKQFLERLYATQIEECDLLDYINTEGSLWIDRVNVPYTDVQRARLGGVALVRNSIFPGHTVSWKFAAPANDQSVAILVPDATPAAFKVIAYNLETTAVRATMTGWTIDPGIWDVTQGVDTNNDDVADQGVESREIPFERTSSVNLTFPPRATTILTFKLKTPGTPYWQRPDLGISKDDITIRGNLMSVTVHCLGSVDTSATTVALIDNTGKTIAFAPVPPLKAPLDLLPKKTDIILTLPPGAIPDGCTVVLDPDNSLEEITKLNNRVGL